jgi:hypothetical protein
MSKLELSLSVSPQGTSEIDDETALGHFRTTNPSCRFIDVKISERERGEDVGAMVLESAVTGGSEDTLCG